MKSHGLKKIEVRICWLVRDNLADVLRIEHESFEFPWTKEDFLNYLRQRNCIGTIAEHDCIVHGFMIHELHGSKLEILNLAVRGESRRHQVGSQIIQKLKEKLSEQRNEIQIEIRESNLDAQLFLKSQGFRAVKIVRNQYLEDDCGEDGYVMQYKIGGPDAENPLHITNRIAALNGEA